MPRYVRGDRSFTRIVKQLPDSVTADIRKQLQSTGKMLLSRAQSKVPVYHGKRKDRAPGALKGGLSYSVPPVRLQLKVGLVGKAINRQLFYGWFVQFGHRIGWRGNKLDKLAAIGARPGSIRYRLVTLKRQRDVRVNGVAPRPFLFTSRQEIYAPFQDLWARALRKAASGASDD